MDYLLPHVRIGHDLDVLGSAKGGQKITVVSGDGAQKATIGLGAGTSLLTDADSAAQLVNAFLVVGPQTGFPPDDLTDALATVVGSVKCYTPPNQDHPFSNVLWSKPPGVFSDIVAAANPYPYPSGSVTTVANVTSGASADVGASVPVYGSIKGSFKSTGLDKYTLHYVNFGSQSKQEKLATFVGVPTALNRLSEEDKQALLNAMTVANAVCTYFNQFYVIQTLSIDVEHSKQAFAAANITAATIFTADGAYNYDSDNTENATLTNKVVNVWGDNFTVTKDPTSKAGSTALIYQPYQPQNKNIIPIGAGPAAATKPPTS